MHRFIAQYAFTTLILCLAVASADSKEKSPGFSEYTPRIVGGSKAQQGEYPWMAALVDKDAPDNADGHFCGGTLIHPYWVFTAAHCVSGIDTEDLRVVVGATDLDNSNQGSIVSAASIVKHPYYFRHSGINYDIALVRLDTSLDQIPTLPLIDDPDLALPGTIAWTIGWGNTSSDPENPVHPSELRELMQPVVSREAANAPDIYDGHVDEDMIPAGFDYPGSGACSGDSGGPLIVPDASGNGWVQAGITSWGRACAREVPYEVYTRVSFYRDWVMSIISTGYERWLDRNGIADSMLSEGGYNTFRFLQYAFSEDLNNSSADSAPQPVTAHIDNLDYPAVKFQRRVQRQDLQYAVEYSSDLRNWSLLHNTNNLVGISQALDHDFEQVTYRGNIALNSSDYHFLRVVANPSSAFSLEGYEISMLNFQQGILAAGSNTDPDRPDSGIYIQDYRILDPKPGQTLIVAADGGSALLVKIIDNATGQMLYSSSANLGEFEAAVTFTPEAGKEYTARVTTTSFRSSAPYKIFAFPQYSSTPINLSDTKTGSITPSDDVFREPGFWIDNYRTNTASSNYNIRMTLQDGGFDAMIYIFDTEVGDIVSLADNEPEGNDEVFLFRIESRESYRIGIANYNASETGSYTLRTQYYNDPEGIYTPSTTQGFFTRVDESYTAEGHRFYYDSFDLYGSISNRVVRVKVEPHMGSTGAVAVYDKNSPYIVASATPNSNGISELTFHALSGRQYEILVVAPEELLGGNYILSTSFN